MRLTYLLTDLSSHAGHTQHSMLYLQTILTHILSLWYIVDALRLNW
jgi:hypothetical protein